MKKSILYSLIITTLIIAACKKDKTEPGATSLTTIQKLQFKWGVDNEVFNIQISGIQDSSTYIGGPVDYVDFRNDGKVY